MKISDLEFLLVQLPSKAPAPALRTVVMRLVTDTGVEGWAEAPLAWRAAELEPRREALLPLLTGRSVHEIEELLQLDALRSRPLCALVEMASWDAIARAAGTQWAHLSGGCYRTHVPLAVRLPVAPSDQLASLARELAEKGYTTQTVTATGDPSADLAQVAAIRDALATRVNLRFDGQGRYTPATARDLCAELADSGLQFFMNPLPIGQLTAMAPLRRQTNVPLAVSCGPSLAENALAVIRASAAEYVVIDPYALGGMAAARKNAAVCELAGLTAILSTAPTGGLAMAALLQLAAACPAFELAADSWWPHLDDDLLPEPLEATDGMLAVPHQPGATPEPDRQKLEQFARG